MVVCWSPIVFMLYPGTLSNDTTNQLSQYYGVILQDANIGFSDHHPVFDTLIFGWTISTFSALFGGFEQGMFTYVVLQAICTALAFSIALNYMLSRLKMSHGWCLGLLIAFCLVPVFPIWVTNISKDTLFSWLFVLFLVQFFEVVRTKGETLKSWKFLLALVAVCVLVALTKKLGVYIVVGSLLMLLIFLRRNVVSVLIPAVSVTLLMFCIMPVLFSFSGVQQGGKQEIFPLLFQQTARYVAQHADEVTEEERQAIDGVLKYDELARQYNYMFADPVKDTARNGGASAYLTWLKTWGAQGFKHPDTYLDAAIALNAYWFSFTSITPIFDSSWHVASYPDIIPEENYERPEFFEKTSSFISNYYNGFTDVPILGLLASEGLYVILLPALALILALKTKERVFLLAFVPIWLSIFFLMLSPISTTHEGSRYLLPLVYSAPLILSWGKFMFDKGIKEEREKAVNNAV